LRIGRCADARIDWHEGKAVHGVLETTRQALRVRQLLGAIPCSRIGDTGQMHYRRNRVSTLILRRQRSSDQQMPEAQR